MTMRLSSSSLAGTARTEVAVGHGEATPPCWRRRARRRRAAGCCGRLPHSERRPPEPSRASPARGQEREPAAVTGGAGFGCGLHRGAAGAIGRPGATGRPCRCSAAPGRWGRGVVGEELPPLGVDTRRIGPVLLPDLVDQPLVGPEIGGCSAVVASFAGVDTGDFAFSRLFADFFSRLPPSSIPTSRAALSAVGGRLQNRPPDCRYGCESGS